MAINNFYPNYYQSAPYQQSEGLLSARSVEEAYNWPVAPGNSLTFKIENQPLVCTKTRGFSPLEQPKFERYKLVKIENEPLQAPNPGANYSDQINMLWSEINGLKARLEGQKGVTNEHVDAVSEVHEQPGAVPAGNPT